MHQRVGGEGERRRGRSPEARPAAVLSCPRPAIEDRHDASWEVDRHVGRRLRARRRELGLTQRQLARLIGVTYQQSQKYESGANRMTAERLFATAAALDVDVDYFFEGVEDGRAPEPVRAWDPDVLSRALAALVRDRPDIARVISQAVAARPETAAARPAPSHRRTTLIGTAVEIDPNRA